MYQPIHIANVASHCKSVLVISHFKVIVNVISFLVAKPVNKCQKIFMSDLVVPYMVLILHLDIHWLIHGVTSVWKIFEETKVYISLNGFITKCPELFQDYFKISIAFIVVFHYLNKLNKQFQGEQNTFREMKEIIF